MGKYQNPILKQISIRENIEVSLFTFPLLEKTGVVRHCFTTRLGGVSEGIFSTMNLSFSRGDEIEAVKENYKSYYKLKLITIKLSYLLTAPSLRNP